MFATFLSHLDHGCSPADEKACSEMHEHMLRADIFSKLTTTTTKKEQ